MSNVGAASTIILESISLMKRASIQRAHCRVSTSFSSFPNKGSVIAHVILPNRATTSSAAE